MLLILTSEKDLAADYLIVRLLERGLQYFRVNCEQLAAADYDFSIGTRASRRLSIAGRELDLDQVGAVWYRRAIVPTGNPQCTPAEQRFVASEIRDLVTGLVFDHDRLWVNSIERILLAENKVYQLRIATRVGLRTASTVVSQDPSRLRAFASRGVPVICKPIRQGVFFDQEGMHSIFTERVDPKQLGDDNSLLACPILLQDEIPRGCDLRATFVGEDVFVAEIAADSSVVDWRVPGARPSYRIGALPEAVEQACRRMLREFGLHFGAFDFIRAPNGDHYFLEVNPTGEWAWLEETLGLQIRDSLIRLLYGLAK